MTPSNQKYTVSYNLNSFIQRYTSLSAATIPKGKARAAYNPSLASLVDVIFCAVYDTNGNLISYTRQDTSQTNFGQITSTLTAGNYQVVFFGSKPGGLFARRGAFNQDYIGLNTKNGGTDAFYKKMNITVSSHDTTQSVMMDRIAAKVIVTIQDQLPAAVTMLTAVMSYDFSAIQVSTGLPAGGVQYTEYRDTLPAASRGKANCTFSFLVLNTTSSYSLELGANANRTVYAIRTINNLNSQPNSSILITGGLFGGGSNDSGGFKVIADPSWNPATINQSF